MYSALRTQHSALWTAAIPGGLTGGAPPVPISNTAVKPSEADATVAARRWESRTLPGFKRPAGRKTGGLFSCVSRPRRLLSESHGME